MKRGFSLVELSIVLVILGLLTGGILAGQSLIRAAELRSVSTEYSRWITAVQGFRDKYMALPGDFRDSTRIWGRLNTNTDCVTNSASAVASPGTCDGDGNGTIIRSNGNSQSGEHFQFWRQLALAGMIEGTYTGVSGTNGYWQGVSGQNIPRSKLGGVAGWTTYTAGVTTNAGSTTTYAMEYGNLFLLGGSGGTADAAAAIIKPEEAWNLDTKIDDGRPGYGKVIAMYWNDACATGGAANNDLANSVYNLAASSTSCALFFRQAF